MSTDRHPVGKVMTRAEARHIVRFSVGIVVVLVSLLASAAITEKHNVTISTMPFSIAILVGLFLAGLSLPTFLRVLNRYQDPPLATETNVVPFHPHQGPHDGAHTLGALATELHTIVDGLSSEIPDLWIGMWASLAARQIHPGFSPIPLERSASTVFRAPVADTTAREQALRLLEESSEEVQTSFLEMLHTLRNSANCSGEFRDLSVRVSVYETLKAVRNSYDFYNYQPWSERQLQHMLDSENLSVHEVANAPTYAALVLNGNPTEPTEGAPRLPRAIILLRAGLSSFTRQCLIAHELGHWFLHAKELSGSGVSFHAPAVAFCADEVQYGILEHQADTFALLGFVPTYELLWWMYEETLTEEHVKQYLAEHYDLGTIQNDPRLARYLGRYCEKRIHLFEKFYQTKLQDVKFPFESLTEETLTLACEWYRERAWGILGSDYRIVRVNENFAAYFGRQAEDFKDVDIGEVLTAESIRRAEIQLRWQVKHLKKSDYFLTYTLDGGQCMVALLHTIPILAPGENGQLVYGGSFAVVVPRRSIDVGKLEMRPVATTKANAGAIRDERA